MKTSTSPTFRDLLEKAYHEAVKSRDPSTQNGAILVDPLMVIPDEEYVKSSGCNNFPTGVGEKNKDRWERPLKYSYIEHAERNAIYSAARRGVRTQGLIMVCPWAACSPCARAIVQSGIKMLVSHKQANDRTPERWRDDIDIALGILDEAGVMVQQYDGEIDFDHELLHSGEFWRP